MPKIVSGRRRVLLGRLVAIGLAQAGAAVTIAVLIDRAFSGLLVVGGAPALSQLAPIAGGLIVAAAAAAWLRMAERTGAERMGQHYTHELRRLLFKRLVSTAPRQLQERTQGAVVLRFVGDLTALQRWVSLGLARLVVAGTMTAGTLVALAVLSWPLAVTIAVILVTGTAVAQSQGRGVRAAAREARRRRSRLAGNVSEKVAAIAVVQAFGQTNQERRRIARQSRRLRDAMLQRARMIGRLRGITEGTAVLAQISVVLVGALIAADPGTIAGAMAILGLLVGPLRDLGQVQEHWHNSRVSREKIASFLATPSRVVERAQAGDLLPGPGKLTFDAVSLEGALDRFSATAEPGQTVAIVGPNGAGKTTLLSLAARLLDPDEGRVLLDDQDLGDHTLDSLRRSVGLVGPDLPLLRGTVERNLRYRWPDAPAEELVRVNALCGIDEVLTSLPDGEDTRIAEAGHGLSAGQRQRIALARALVGDPTLLLLDEADANLDARAAEVIDRVLADRYGTVLLVTHRLDRLAAADVVWYVEAGQLLEAGPVKELLAGDGPTARLLQARPAGATA